MFNIYDKQNLITYQVIVSEKKFQCISYLEIAIADFCKTLSVAAIWA